MNIQCKPFDYKNTLNHQRALFKECFPEAHGTAAETTEHYHWKFHSFPHETPSYEYSAWCDEEMIGYYAALPYRYTIDECSFTAGMVCDVMTGSNARGKGVFTKLGRFSTESLKKKGIDFVTGYPIRPEVIPGHIKVGWRVVFRMPIYIRILKSRSIFKKYNLSLLAHIVDPLLIVYNRIIAQKNYDSSYSSHILTQEEFFKLDDYADFFRLWQSEASNTLCKDMKFMKWRLSAPGCKYSIVTVRQKGTLVGLAVTRSTELENIPVLAVVDFMILSGHYECLHTLHDSIETIAKNLECEAIATMVSKIWRKRYRLLAFGFVRTPYFFSLILKKLNESINDDDLFDERKWHLMWIDSDDL